MDPNIYAMAWKGDIDGTRHLLTIEGMPIDATTPSSNRTLLHLAVMRSNPDLVQMLLEFKPNTDIRDVQGWTALDYAHHTQCLAKSKPEVPLYAAANAIVGLLQPVSKDSEGEMTQGESSMEKKEDFSSLPPVMGPSFVRNYTEPLYCGGLTSDRLPAVLMEMRRSHSVGDNEDINHLLAKEALSQRLMAGQQVYSDLTLQRIFSEDHDFPFGWCPPEGSSDHWNSGLQEFGANDVFTCGHGEEKSSEGLGEQVQTNELEDPSRLSLDSDTEEATIHSCENILSGPALEPEFSESSPEVETAQSQNKSKDVTRKRTASISLPRDCQICLLPHRVELLMSPCVVTGCKGAFCKPCIQQYLMMMVENSRYSCPAMRCPACSQRLRTRTWKRLVPTELFQAYQNNARSLTLIRCDDCDQPEPVIPIPEPDNRDSAFRNRMQLVAFAGLNMESKQRLMAAWLKFNNGAMSADHFLDVLHFEFTENCDDPCREHWKASSKDGAFMLDVEDDIEDFNRVKDLFSLILDIERRTVLKLAWLRRFPRVRTFCCRSMMCFKCKTGGWHEDKTCEEMQLEENSREVQYCPSCLVPTIKSEGCSHMLCVCGAEWDWEGGSDEDY